MSFQTRLEALASAIGADIKSDRGRLTALESAVNAPAIQGTLSNATLITETVIASFALPANHLVAGTMLNLRMLGQVSANATLTYRLRIGPSGVITDPLVASFVASAAGVANAYSSADMLVRCLTDGASGTIIAGGQAQLAGAVVGPVTAAFSAATVNTMQPRTLVLTLAQSALQTFTTRAATLGKVV